MADHHRPRARGLARGGAGDRQATARRRRVVAALRAAGLDRLASDLARAFAVGADETTPDDTGPDLADRGTGPCGPDDP